MDDQQDALMGILSCFFIFVSPGMWRKNEYARHPFFNIRNRIVGAAFAPD
jgi:hypothetical protein